MLGIDEIIKMIKKLSPSSSISSTNTFLMETEHNSDVDDAIRNEIEKRFVRSKMNDQYRFPRIKNTPSRKKTNLKRKIVSPLKIHDRVKPARMSIRSRKTYKKAPVFLSLSPASTTHRNLPKEQSKLWFSPVASPRGVSRNLKNSISMRKSPKSLMKAKASKQTFK